MDTSNAEIRELYKTFTNPDLSETMSLLKLDKVYHRSSGDYIFSYHNNEESNFLDLAGGYGSLILGHNNEDLISYAKDLLSSNLPFHSQLSIRKGSALLSAKLNQILLENTGENYIFIYANSGAEAVEVALKHSLFKNKEIIDNLLSKVESGILNIKNYYEQKKIEFSYNFDHQTFNTIHSFANFINRKNEIHLQKSCILATKGSFHGKTLGALSATYNSSYKKSDQKDLIATVFFDWDKKELEDIFEKYSYPFYVPKINNNGEIIVNKILLSRTSSVIVEPILGEGGIIKVPDDILLRLRELTNKYKIPLIFDEIQCGFYRVGELLSSFKRKIYPDYYILGKSLSGGISKLSLVAINKKKYLSGFGLIHTSTFAEDDFSCLIALKALNIAEKNKRIVCLKGDLLISRLNILKNEFPEVIEEIRGEGLMLGIKFLNYNLSSSKGFQTISRADLFGYIVISYLLNKQNLRVSVTLSNSFVIRLYPSLFISEKTIDKLINSLREVLHILDNMDFYKLIEHLLPNEYQNLRSLQKFKKESININRSKSNVERVGFLTHFIDAENAKISEPSFNILPSKAIEFIFRSFLNYSHCAILGQNVITNNKGKETEIVFIGLPFTSKMVKDDISTSIGAIKDYQKLCNNSIEFLMKNGVTRIGLGQFNSIILNNGKSCLNSNAIITTGNSYTVYSSYQKIKKEVERRKTGQTIGIVGAGGNIATELSKLIVPFSSEIVLIGSSQNSQQKIINHACEIIKYIHETEDLTGKLVTQIKKLSINENPVKLNSDEIWQLYQKEFDSKPIQKKFDSKPIQKKFDSKPIQKEFDSKPIIAHWDLSLLKKCDIIILATSESKPFIYNKHLKAGVLVVDISVPSNCAKEVIENEAIEVVHGGTVNLPEGNIIDFKEIPLPKGKSYACMAETILLGLEGSSHSFSFGSLNIDQIKMIGEIADKNGFNK